MTDVSDWEMDETIEDYEERLRAAEARAEVALQERDEARERHIAGLAATRGRIKSLKHDRSRLRSQVRDLTIRAEAAEQALRILLRDTYHLSCTPEEWAIVERARAALAGREPQ